MPVNYSKWDNLELSDDSDFEPHPNVDKRSFIRAKQAQIHQQRAQRKHRIETLKYERMINDGMLRRIDTLLAELRAHEAEAKDRNQFLFQALISSAGDPDEDEPAKPPEGVHEQAEPVRYSQIMGALVDQVKKEADEAGGDEWAKGYIKGVEAHKKKVAGLQKDLQAELDRLEREAASKITSDDVREGFNSSHVAKATVPDSGAGKSQTVEVLNPAALKRDQLAGASSSAGFSSGTEADVDEKGSNVHDDKAAAASGGSSHSAPAADDEDEVEVSALARRFSQIKVGDYRGDMQFISANQGILTDGEQDGLLMLAFDEQLKGNEQYAQQCVHQSLLIQYCKALGRDGVALFFRRITTPGHQAMKVFLDDVDQTYKRIRTRTAEIVKERAEQPDQVEQIQLQAVEPGTEIQFFVPSKEAKEEPEMSARKTFEMFPPGLQRALESGSLDRVNEVLGKMSVEEAEEVVEQLGDSGMLDMRKGVIDGTTEEGKEQIRKMEEERDAQQKEEAALEGGEPGGVEVADVD